MVMDMDRIMPVTLWSTLGGGDEVDMLEDIDGKERRWWSAQHHLTVMERQRQHPIGARKAAVEEDWKRLRIC